MPSPEVRSFFERMSQQGLMLTYDDVRLRSKHSDVAPTEANVASHFSRRIRLNIPIVSSPMDTVTNASMAIAMAEAGGIGIIHRNLSPDVQAKEVARVKHRLHGRIETPITVRTNESVKEVLARRKEKGFAFSTFPVIDSEGAVIGIVTGSDFDFCTNHDQSVSQIMTPLSKLLFEREDPGKDAAYRIMIDNKKKTLLLVNESGGLLGMYAFADLKRVFSSNKHHNTDENGQLVVGAAVGAGEEALKRAALLFEKGCNLFHIDTAHGDSKRVFETLSELKKRFPLVDVAAGNVSSGRGAKSLADAGADAVMVGQGPGSICTTRVVAGIGVPQVSAVFECVEALEGTGIPVCADGGIANSGDIVIALAVGATSVMLGRLLAGTEEAPGETQIRNGVMMKMYRGMGSLGAMQDSLASRQRYGQGTTEVAKVVPEGVEGAVPYQGHVGDMLRQYVGGIQSGMGYLGARTIEELTRHAEIFRMSGAGLKESHPHDIMITAQAPNYQGKTS